MDETWRSKYALGLIGILECAHSEAALEQESPAMAPRLLGLKNILLHFA